MPISGGFLWSLCGYVSPGLDYNIGSILSMKPSVHSCL